MILKSDKVAGAVQIGLFYMILQTTKAVSAPKSFPVHFFMPVIQEILNSLSQSFTSNIVSISVHKWQNSTFTISSICMFVVIDPYHAANIFPKSRW